MAAYANIAAVQIWTDTQNKRPSVNFLPLKGSVADHLSYPGPWNLTQTWNYQPLVSEIEVYATCFDGSALEREMNLFLTFCL